MNDKEELRRLIFQMLDDSGKQAAVFAKDIGVLPSLVSQWRNGTSSSFCKKEYIAKIANYFHVSTDFLLGINSDEVDYDINEIVEAVKSREEVRELFNIVKHMNKSDVEKATRIITALKE